MHKKAQYVDGKLVDEKGQFIIEKPKLVPPPPPRVEIRRKNISISIETWQAWKDIKGTKKWDTILKEALDLFNKVKDLEGIITKIALQKPTIIQGEGYNVGSPRNLTRIPGAKFRQTPLNRKKKIPFLDEIKELVNKLDKEDKDIRSVLKQLDDKELKNIQKTEEELDKKREEAEKRSLKYWHGDVT